MTKILKISALCFVLLIIALFYFLVLIKKWTDVNNTPEVNLELEKSLGINQTPKTTNESPLSFSLNEPLNDPNSEKIRQILLALSKNIESEQVLTQTSFSWWKTENGSLVPLDSLSLRLLFPAEHPKETYNNVAYNMSTDNDIFFASSTISNFFSEQGFEVNQINTDIDNGIFYFYAFEKNDLYCTLVLEPASSELGWVDCGVLDETIIENNKPFNGVLKWFDGSQNNLQISVEKIIGNAAKGGISVWHAPSGGFWIAVKKDGVWQQIYIGQESPPCDLMDENKVPVEIYENCFEDQAGRFRSPDTY